jgi:two-component system response regulator PilR (NtrC family)
MPKNRIIVVDDEKAMRDFLKIMLAKEGYDVRTMASGDKALEYCKSNPFDLVITDVKMPGMSGVEFLKALRQFDDEVPVIMITAYASVDTAIEAMKAGAYDYFTKPFNVDEIKLDIRKALNFRELKRENRLLKKDLKSRYDFANFIGTSPAMARTYGLIISVAKTRTNVLITGESGTGKELVARAIHYESDRRDGPYVAINCGAIPENLMESELFGHMKGAFTGAVSGKVGLVEQADGGTLFLDEITEMAPHLQVKFLRFIQERTFRRVGATGDTPVDLRIIAASNKDVEVEIKAGRFREDLFYRLNVIRINMPPLRDRMEDVALLVRHFIEKYSGEHGHDIMNISEEAMRMLMEYDYPGNIRELENIIERAVTLEPTKTITHESLDPDLFMHTDTRGPSKAGTPDSGEQRGWQWGREIPPEGIDMEKTVQEFERAMIAEAMKKSGGVKKKAAELLGLSFRSMRYKLSKYDLSES